jgi:hypothetical protein
MPELDFEIEAVEVERFAVTPTLLFGLHITARDATPIQNIALRCQFRIEPGRRGYDADDEARLFELFGEKRRWGQTLRSFLWDHVNFSVPAFTGECRVKLPIACGHDFNVAATKYFHGLDDGVAPLSCHFSGAIFYDDSDHRLQIGQIAWNREARFDLPVAAWRSLMAEYYPDTTWLRVRNDLFERLYCYKRDNGFVDWEGALDSLLPVGAARHSS